MIQIRPIGWTVAVAVAAVGAAVLTGRSAPAAAAPVDVYEVTDVAVDVTAETAAEARKQALSAGEKLAFRKLLERLTLQEDHARLPDFAATDIAPYVKDFAVADEKTSAVRYLAKLSVRFKRSEVRALLNEFDIPFAETPSKAVLVLPVYQAAGTLVLWDEPNPWRDAWAGRSGNGSLVPFALPIGDLADIAMIGAEQAHKGDRQRLAAIAARYRSAEVAVVVAVRQLDAAVARPRIEAYITRFSEEQENRTDMLTFRQDAAETPEALLARAADGVARRLEDEWKQRNLLEFDSIGVAAVTVPVDTLKTWLTVRDRLNTVTLIRRVEMVLLSRDEVRVNLHYLGNPDQLAVALIQADLTLSKEEDEWVLSTADDGKPGQT